MSKAPAFQFYPADWQRDLSEHPLEIEGAWIRICCALWWSDTPGKATKPLINWARILREKERKTLSIINYLLNQNIAEVVIQNDNITISSRRMAKDEYIRNIRRNAGSLGGNPSLKGQENKNNLDKQNIQSQVNQKPTPSSSSSSSSTNHIVKSIKFIIPTVDEVSSYCSERKNGINPQVWMDHYTSNGWMVGRNKMRDWKAAIRTWETRGGNGNGKYESRSGYRSGESKAPGSPGRAKGDGEPYPIDHEF